MPPDAVVLVAAVCASLETLDYLLQCLPRKIAARRFDDTGCAIWDARQIRWA